MSGCCADKACSTETCMRLPEGVTCGTCVSFARCSGLIGIKADNTICDWFPRRYREDVAARLTRELAAEKAARAAAEGERDAAWARVRELEEECDRLGGEIREGRAAARERRAELLGDVDVLVGICVDLAAALPCTCRDDDPERPPTTTESECLHCRAQDGTIPERFEAAAARMDAQREEVAALRADLAALRTPLDQLRVIRLADIRDDAATRDALRDARVFIYSQEHDAFWRPNGSGYTPDRGVAGVYSWGEAWRRTRGCGPEKGIAYYVLPDPGAAPPPPRVPVGTPGVRDPENPCAEFLPGPPEGDCETDAHYVCRECVHYRPERAAANACENAPLGPRDCDNCCADRDRNGVCLLEEQWAAAAEARRAAENTENTEEVTRG